MSVEATIREKLQRAFQPTRLDVDQRIAPARRSPQLAGHRREPLSRADRVGAASQASRACSGIASSTRRWRRSSRARSTPWPSRSTRRQMYPISPLPAARFSGAIGSVEMVWECGRAVQGRLSDGRAARKTNRPRVGRLGSHGAKPACMAVARSCRRPTSRDDGTNGGNASGRGDASNDASSGDLLDSALVEAECLECVERGTAGGSGLRRAVEHARTGGSARQRE